MAYPRFLRKIFGNDGAGPKLLGSILPFGTGAPKALGTAGAGTADEAARADHVHPQIPVATTISPGLMSSGDKARLDDWSTSNLAGPGLGVSAGALRINDGPGIVIADDKVSVKMGNGLSSNDDYLLNVDAFAGASASQDGKAGLAPAPAKGSQNKFLRGDGTWAKPSASDLAGPGLGTSGDSIRVNDGPGIVILNDLVQVNAGTGLAFDGTKLVVDFSANNEASKNLVLGLIKSRGGLAVDDNGKIYVNFASIDDDIVKGIMKKLGLLFPLTANKNFYVGGAGASDTLDAGRGESAAKAFAKIQACIDYVTANYAMGKFNAYINIATGTYSEPLTLPDFSRTTGSIILRCADESTLRNVTIQCSAQASNSGSDRYTVTARGGAWHLRGVKVKRVVPGDSASRAYAGCISALAPLTLTACEYELDISACTSSGKGSFTLIGGSTNGQITFGLSPNSNIIRLKQAATSPALAYAFNLNAGSQLTLYDGDATGKVTIVASGTFNTFMNVLGGRCTVQQGSYSPVISPNGTGDDVVTGKRYHCGDGGVITGLGTLKDTFFPGTSAGTVDASTYSWCN